MAKKMNMDAVQSGKQMLKAVGTVFALTVLITFVALILQTILGLDIMANVDVINVTLLKSAIGDFLVGLWGFFGLAGIVISIVWVISYVRALFSKETGLSGITA